MHHLLTNMHVDPELFVPCKKKRSLTGNRQQPSSSRRGSPKGLTHPAQLSARQEELGVGDHENKTICTKSCYCSKVKSQEDKWKSNCSSLPAELSSVLVPALAPAQTTGVNSESSGCFLKGFTNVQLWA